MKLFVIIFSFVVLLSSVAFADDLDDAKSAWERNDFQTAAKLLEPVAARGDAEAQFRLCALYFKGEGVPKEASRAAILCRKSAEQGHAGAQSFLGWMYRSGSGVKKNDVEAFKWFSKSAEQNESTAQAALGAMYASGEGTKKDLVQAYKWVSVARTMEGDDGEDADEFSGDIKDLAAEMPPADVDEAARLAKSWIADHPPPLAKSRVSPKLFLAVFLIPAFIIACLPGRQQRFHFYYRLFTWMAICSILLTPLFIWLSHASQPSISDPALARCVVWTAALSLTLLYVDKRCSFENMTYLESLMWAMASVSGSWGGTRVVLGILLLIFVMIASLGLTVVNDITGRSKYTAAQYSRLIGRIYRNRMVQ